MKYCPQCNSRYADETLNFCLSCGAPVLGSDPSAETLKFKSEPAASTERIYKQATLTVGEYYDLKTKYRNIRIDLRELIEEADNRYSARIYINTGGGLVFGGPGTLEAGTNEFWLQPKTYQEELNAIYYYYNSELDTSFFRVIIEHINIHKREVELNIVSLLYNTSV